MASRPLAREVDELKPDDELADKLSLPELLNWLTSCWICTSVVPFEFMGPAKRLLRRSTLLDPFE